MKTSLLQNQNENRSRAYFHLRTCATVALLATAIALALSGMLATGTQDVTGTYMADDGGIYYVQQSGNTVWWTGMSLDTDLTPDLQWHRGLEFTNVFRGTIDAGGTVTGEWSDVTRGTILQNGTLSFQVVGTSGSFQFTRNTATGGFRGSTWNQNAPLDDTKFNGNTADLYSRFGAVYKNGGETFIHDYKPYRDATVVYGQLITSARVGDSLSEDVSARINFPTAGTAARDFGSFASENLGDDGSKDGDIDIRLKLDLNKLEPDFLISGWDNSPDVISEKLNSTSTQNILGFSSRFAQLHPEVSEYARPATGGGPSMLPGWADLNSNSVLVNGRPMNGVFNRVPAPDPCQTGGDCSVDCSCNFIQPCPYFNPSPDPACNEVSILGNIFFFRNTLTDGVQVGNQRLTAGTYVRITGALILDCGHGTLTDATPCYDEGDSGDSDQQNQEIHPVYSIDVLNPPFTPEDIGVSARPNLTGTWGGTDGSTYYVRQIGNTVWLLGLMRDRQPLPRNPNYPIIGFRQVAAAGLLVGSPLCGPSTTCWMFGIVAKGTVSQNSDGTATIQADWAGAPQSTSPGSTGGMVSFSVDIYHKVITPLTMPVLFPDKLEKLYEPEDTTPPQSTLTIGTPQYPNGSSQPFVSAATSFTLNATDTGSGVQNVWYRFYPNGTTPPAYTSAAGSSATFYLSGTDGVYEIDTYATDAAGNDETSHTQLVYLDSTAPVATITAPTAKQYLHSDTFTINYSVSDGAGSGVKTATVDIDGLTTLYDGTTPVTVANGVTIKLLTELTVNSHTFNVHSVDNLGNAGTNSVTFSIVVTADSIIADVKYFRSIGAITLDEATSLLQKLNAAAAYRAKGDCKDANATYQAFINELRAQSGKKVTVQAANIMISDAQYLVAHCP